MEKRKNVQLYRFIESLSSRVRDESCLGLLVGYSVARSLLQFEPAQYGREPRSFKEVWAVYEELAKVSNSLCPKEVYLVIAGLKEQVNPKLKQYFSGLPNAPCESDLLEGLVRAAKSKSIPLEEYLKEIGSKISRKTLERGLSTEAINRVFTEDYKLLQRTISC
jgi:hypothetical protein